MSKKFKYNYSCTSQIWSYTEHDKVNITYIFEFVQIHPLYVFERHPAPPYT